MNKQELKALCRIEIRRYTGISGKEYMVELLQRALASLTADPDFYVFKHPLGKNFWSVAADSTAGNDGIHPAYFTPPATDLAAPEKLPCDVLLEPGLRFGKGVSTKTMLTALKRRAEYYAELEEMTPEQRAEHDAGLQGLKSMLPQPVSPDLAAPAASIEWLIPVLEGIKPEYGTPGSRDIDITASRKAIDLAIEQIKTGSPEPRGVAKVGIDRG